MAISEVQPLQLKREYVPCALCGGSNSVVRFQTRGMHHTAIWKGEVRYDVVSPETIVKCRLCGLVYVNPRMMLDADAASYSFEQQKAYFTSTHSARLKAYRDLLRQVPTWLGYAPRDILDIGCGDGVLLEVAREGDLHAVGTEISTNLVQLVRERMGDAAVDARALGEMSSESYDVVALVNVLEHVADPVEMLHMTRRVLRPGGIVLTHVPNFGGVPAKLRGVRWHQVEPLEHLYYFTGQTLSAALHKAGLAPFERFNLIVSSGAKERAQRMLGKLGVYLDNGLGMVARRSDNQV